MGRSYRTEKWKKVINGKGYPKQRKSGKSNKELELLENGYSEDDMDLSYQNGNNIDQFGNQRN